MAGLSIGDLDRYVTLQTGVAGQSTSGEETIDFSSPTEEMIFAEWLSGTATETVQSQARIGAYLDGVFRIRWRDDVSPKFSRIVDERGRIFDVKGALEDSKFDKEEALLVPVVAAQL